MRLSVFLLFLMVAQAWAVTSYSQSTRLSLNMKDTRVIDVLNEIEAQSDFYFLFNEKLVNVERKVDVEVKQEKIYDILNQIFAGTNVNFFVMNKQIVLTTAQTETEESVSEQQNQVSGKVTDKTGSVLPGVSVVVKGTSAGTITNADGKYTLAGIPANGTLVFSFVGMKTQEIAVNNQTVINVEMADETIGLEEVVAIGYGKNSRKNLTSAITSVKSDELNRGALVDVGQLLQGKVPGMNISVSGDPNKRSSVILRGASTLNSSQTPFYVIDNIPGADIASVAPDDISSIEILKDAAATAIYGNRAANGVIMVTTRKGNREKAQVEYSTYYGVETVSNQLDMMDARQLRAFVTANGMAFSPENDKGANTNWQKEILRSSAISSSHNLSFSGGGEHSSYNASLTFMDKKGIMLSSGLKRVIAHLSLEQTAFRDRVKFGLNVSNSNNKAQNVPQRNSVLLQAVNHLPVSPVYNEDGTFFENFATTGYFNPVALIKHGDDDTKYNILSGIFTTEMKLPWGFTYNLNVSYTNSTSLHGEFYDSYYQQYNSANFYNNPDPPATHVILNFGMNGSAIRNTYQNSNTIAESFLTWNNKFGRHNFNAVLGYSWQQSVNGDGFQASTTNFPVDNISYNNLALSNYTSVSGYVVNFGADGIYQKVRLISDFARLNYNYNDRYLLQTSIRRDGSSVFGANHKWGYFPSVGLAWRVINEGFMQNQHFLSDLKLRASYGVTGNSTGFNAYTAQFISGSQGTFYYNGSQIGAYGPTQAANPDLKWEKTATSNVGVDFSVFQGRLSVTAEVYHKKTTGMIYTYAVNPVLVPVGSIVANGGSLSNKGVELSITAIPVRTGKFSWSTNLNLAHNKNLIEKLTNPLFSGGDSVRITQPDGGGQTGSTLQILKAGKPLGEFFTLQYAGKNSNGISQYMAKNGDMTTAPSIGVDYHYAGSAQPKLLLGWTNDFRYGRFDLNVFIRGVLGNKIFNATRADLFRPTTAHLSNILVDAGEESVKDVNSFKYSTRFIENGSYIRLDNATLGYNLENIGTYIKNLRIYTMVNNLFVITRYKGVDPEVEQGGIAPGVDSNNFYPKTRSVMLGLKVIF